MLTSPLVVFGIREGQFRQLIAAKTPTKLISLCLAVHYVVPLCYDRTSSKSRLAAVACCRELIAHAAAAGYTIYRSHLLFQDQITSSMSFNNHALNRFNESIKDALDPNSIIQPGRNGIWGSRWKNKGWELQGGEEHSDPTERTRNTKSDV